VATSFPGAVDAFTNPTGTDNLSDEIGGRTHAEMHADINDGMEAVQAHVLQGITVANVQTADYVAVLSDAGKVIELNKATAIDLEIPPASSVAWPTGTVISVYQAGAGNATVSEGAGVTIRNLAALRGQYAEASLRYRGSDEWVLEGDLATASAPALKDYAEVLLTSGSLTLNATAVTAVSTSLDLTISAAAGDLVEYNISGLLDATRLDVVFDVYTLPSGSPVNPFAVGISASGASTQGVPGWEQTVAESTSTGTTGASARLMGGISRILTSDDVSGGSTVLRLYYAKPNTTARTLFAIANIPLKVWAKNYGQV
jgi:hypothetical protein